MSTELPFHPLADVFPLIEGTDFDDLVTSIQANGLRHPIIILDGMILDGRNRYRACLKAGVEPLTKAFVGNDPIAFVVDENIRRRHLSESQRAVVAAKLANMPTHRPADKSANLPTSQSTAAERLNVSTRSVTAAKSVIQKGAPGVVAAVVDGKVSVSAAAKFVKLPIAKQERQLEKHGSPEAAMKAFVSPTKHKAKPATPAVQESRHDHELRFLRDIWRTTCDSARAAFLKEIGFELRAIA